MNSLIPSPKNRPKRKLVGSCSPSSSIPFTVFISHAGEDKATIAIPLRERLRAKGISAFVDETDMPPGTEAKRAMMQAMETAKIAVIILSPEFIVKKWPVKEMMCFLKRREECLTGGSEMSERTTVPMIVPFFYRLSVSELYDEPKLDRRDRDGVLLHEKSRFYERQKNGEAEASIGEIKVALEKLHGIMGVRNTVEANNDSSYDMSKKRKLVLDELCEEICKVEREVMKLETSNGNVQGIQNDSPQRAKKVRVASRERRGASAGGYMEENAFGAEKPYCNDLKKWKSEALFNLAVVLREGAPGVERDTEQAVKVYRRAIKAGNVNAIYQLAWILQHGIEGVRPDAVEAAKLYRQAIDAGHVDAINNLAMLLHHGVGGVERDTVEAETLFRRAIKTGDTNAMHNFGLILARGERGGEGDAVEGETLLRRAIELGHIDSMFSLAVILRDGTEVVKKDTIEAVKLYRRAAENGHVNAMYCLAVMLDSGDKGMRRDAEEAEKLYRRAAEAGNASAMYELGMMLRKKAEGGEGDKEEAEKYYHRGVVQLVLDTFF